MSPQGNSRYVPLAAPFMFIAKNNILFHSRQGAIKKPLQNHVWVHRPFGSVSQLLKANGFTYNIAKIMLHVTNLRSHYATTIESRHLKMPQMPQRLSALFRCNSTRRREFNPVCHSYFSDGFTRSHLNLLQIPLPRMSSFGHPRTSSKNLKPRLLLRFTTQLARARCFSFQLLWLSGGTMFGTYCFPTYSYVIFHFQMLGLIINYQ